MTETTADHMPEGERMQFAWLIKSPPQLVMLRALLIIAAPLFALVTWQPIYYHTWTRHLSVPVVLCEAAIVALAFATKFDLDKAVRALNPLTRNAAFVWLAVSAWASLYVAEPGQGANYLFATSALHALFALTLWWKLKTDWKGYGPHMLAAIAIGVVAYIVVILVLALAQMGNDDFIWRKFGAGVSAERQFAYYGLTLSGIAGGMLAFAKGRGPALICAALLVAGFWLTIWAGGRSAFVAMIGALLVIGLLAPQISRVRYGLQVVGALAVAIALSYSFVPHERYGLDSILQRTVSVSETKVDSFGQKIESRGAVSEFTSGRTDMWAETLEKIGERPLFGHGEGQFRFTVETAFGHLNHPHNSPLQMLFQWGIIGTLALLAMLFGTVKRTALSIRNLPKRAVIALGPVSGLLAMSLLDGAAYYVFPVMVMLVCLTIIATSLDGKDNAPARVS